MHPSIDSTASSRGWRPFPSGLALMLILGATHCGASKTTTPGPAGAQPVDNRNLELAWPQGLSGTMVFEQTTFTGGKERSVMVTYSVATTEVADGTELAFSDARDISMTGHSDDAQDVGLPTLKTIPAVVVRRGEVVRVPNVDAVREAIHESLDEMFGGIPGLAKRMKSEVTNEFVFDAAHGAWEARGASYHGRTFAPGAEVLDPAEVPLKLLKGQIQGTYVMSLEAHLTCPGTTDRRCVKLRRTLVLEPEVLQKAFDDARGTSVDSGRLERSFTSELIADARTLLPFRLEKTDYARLVQVRDGKEQSRVESEAVVETYSWE